MQVQSRRRAGAEQMLSRCRAGAELVQSRCRAGAKVQVQRCRCKVQCAEKLQVLQRCRGADIEVYQRWRGSPGVLWCCVCALVLSQLSRGDCAAACACRAEAEEGLQRCRGCLAQRWCRDERCRCRAGAEGRADVLSRCCGSAKVIEQVQRWCRAAEQVL
jgi:hypothetical protein